MMAAMKSFNKVLGNIRKSAPFSHSADRSPSPSPSPAPQLDTDSDSPEVMAARCIAQFCEAGPNQAGDEVTFLPPIVDAAECSPAAAAECARLMRKYLGRDSRSKPPSHQYNAIMLLRILADNPGPTFTRNLDKKFQDTVKDLLVKGRDAGVRQMLMETLDSWETHKAHDEGLAPVIEMWKKEKAKASRHFGGRPPPPVPMYNAPPPPQPMPSQEYFARHHTNTRLPEAAELSNRLEEARSSAKLLEQVVACTPSTEVCSNDLIKEFSDRCLSASRSIQGYMAATEPAPDNDTMETLIDTNEQLQQALNQHRRAVLSAKKQTGQDSGTHSTHSIVSTDDAASVERKSLPVPVQRIARGASSSSNAKGKATEVYEVYDAPKAGPSRATTGTPEDPFQDPDPDTRAAAVPATDADPPRLAYEPFHPGFSNSPSGRGTGQGAGDQRATGSSTPERRHAP